MGRQPSLQNLNDFFAGLPSLPERVACKIVIDCRTEPAMLADLAFARMAFSLVPRSATLHLSVMTPHPGEAPINPPPDPIDFHAPASWRPATVDALRRHVGEGLRRLAEHVAGNDHYPQHVTVTPQIHVLAWGAEQGR